MLSIWVQTPTSAAKAAALNGGNFAHSDNVDSPVNAQTLSALGVGGPWLKQKDEPDSMEYVMQLLVS
jgi:hypothetical protein